MRGCSWLAGCGAKGGSLSVPFCVLMYWSRIACWRAQAETINELIHSLPYTLLADNSSAFLGCAGAFFSRVRLITIICFLQHVRVNMPHDNIQN